MIERGDDLLRARRHQGERHLRDDVPRRRFRYPARATLTVTDGSATNAIARPLASVVGILHLRLAVVASPEDDACVGDWLAGVCQRLSR